MSVTVNKHVQLYTAANKMADHICQICGKIFAQLRQMKRHVRVEHEGKRHECSICHKQFTRLYKLTKHKKLHSKVVCKYNFKLCSIS